MLIVFVVGTAGSGKSTLVDVLSDNIEGGGMEVFRVNLDPAAQRLPYEANLDARDFVNIDQLINDYGLGPNGAIIAATDMLMTHIDKIVDEIYRYGARYTIVDTPGQMELFAFRESGGYIVSSLCKERCATIYLIDALLATTPSTFLSSILLSASVYYKLSHPQINVLNKTDLLDEDSLSSIFRWVDSSEDLLQDLAGGSGGLLHLNAGLYDALRTFLEEFNLHPISSKLSRGIGKLSSLLQQIYVGGEDYEAIAY